VGRARRVGILLNRHAQRVTPELVERLGRALPPAVDLFATDTLEESREAARTLIARGCEVVCVGGGDGTFIQAAADLLDAAPNGAPALLPLRLGSGNAIADVAGSGAHSLKGILGDVERARSGGMERPMRLLRVDGRPAHFAGAGIDAKLNEDFRDVVKQGIGRGRFGRVFHGPPGIMISLVVRTIPRLIAEPQMRVLIRNTGATARRLGPEGETTGTVATGDVLFDGPVTIAAASTITQYARGLTFFPFAGRIGAAFQVRASNAGAREVLPHIPSIFAGTYRNPEKIRDFAATGVRFEMPCPVPVHVGGDLWGDRTELTIELDPRIVTLIAGVPAV
jgi:diacylglycerol kinase family enzyme